MIPEVKVPKALFLHIDMEKKGSSFRGFLNPVSFLESQMWHGTNISCNHSCKNYVQFLLLNLNILPWTLLVV